jgi:predicted ArsR family transcriptional regulator
MVKQLFTQMALDISSEYSQITETMSIEEKLNLITDILSREGFTVDWDHDTDGYRINEISCPYYHIGQKHPEICNVDQTMIASILSIPVEKISCVLGGGNQCTYLVKQTPVSEGAQ